MDEYDLDDLLDCDDIEQSSFMNSSRQIFNVIDNLLVSIDERIGQKRGFNSFDF